MSQMVLQKGIAVAGGLTAGAVVHIISRVVGLDVTLPGSLWACAFATAMLCSVRFTFK
jgi:hypothetical protein